MLCFGFSVYIQKTSVKQFSHVLVPAKTNKKREREKDKNYQLQLSVFYIYCIFSFPPQYERSYIICSGGRWNEKPFSQDYFSCTPSRLRGAELKLDNTQLQCRYIALLIHLHIYWFSHWPCHCWWSVLGVFLQTPGSEQTDQSLSALLWKQKHG